MNYLKISGMISAAAAVVVLTGCNCCKTECYEKEVPVPCAKTTAKVKLDGVIDAKEWAAATPVDIKLLLPSFNNMPPKNKAAVLARNYEKGKAYLMYDKKNLYIAADMIDTDVMQFGKEDQGNLCSSGDLFEVFLKPVNSPAYWEIWGSPNKLRTTFFYESASYPFVPASQQAMMKGFKIGVKVNGTLNNNKDKDKGWSIECQIPLSELAKTGISFAPGQKWTVLIARYNYNLHFGDRSNNYRGPQFSSFPALPQINYHFLPYYGVIDWK